MTMCFFGGRNNLALVPDSKMCMSFVGGNGNGFKKTQSQLFFWMFGEF